METEIAPAKAAAAASRAADEAAAAEVKSRAQPRRRPRIRRGCKPALPFADAKGQVALPAAGTILKAFGAPGRFRRRRKGRLDRDAGRGDRRFADRRMGRFFRSLSNLWATLDNQCRRGLLYGAGWYGPNQCGGRSVRPGGRAGRLDGRRFGEDGRCGRYWRRAAHSLYRTSQGRSGNRSGAVVGEDGHRKGTRMMRKVSYLVLGAAIGAAAVSLGPQSVAASQ